MAEKEPKPKLTDILKNYNSPNHDFVNSYFLRSCQKSKEIIARESIFLGNELKRSASYNQNLWEQISEALKTMSDGDIEKKLNEEARQDINLMNFLRHVRQGRVPLKPDHGCKIGELKTNDCFYDIEEKKFFVLGGNPLTDLGFLANEGLIDIECLDPERVLKNFKKE
jgi:hypothetical protein